MPPWFTGDVMMVALKSVSGDGSSMAMMIPVFGSAGVDLGVVGRALGLDPSTVRFNGHFVSRGTDFVSSLPWSSLLSFFASRGFPTGGSLLDAIVVQGKHIAITGWDFSSDMESVGHTDFFKRKGTINDEKPCKKSRLLGSLSMEQNVDDSCLCIKRKYELADGHPTKKGRIGELRSGVG